MGNYSIVILIAELQEKSDYEGIIEFLHKNANSIYDNGETPLYFAMGDRALWSRLSLKGKKLLIEKSDVKYIYNGPSDKTNQKVRIDNYLHMAARVQDEDAFVSIWKKNIALVTNRNSDGNNPFHEAAMSGILLPVIKKILSEDQNKIKKAEESGDLQILKSPEESLEENLKCIKYALQSKEYAFNNEGKTPLFYLDPFQKKKIKEIASIKDSFICNKKLHASLYVVGAIVCVTALCLSLYFLFLANATFALSSIASMAVGGTAFLSLKACNEVFKLSEEGAVNNVVTNNYTTQEMEVC